MRVVIDVDDNVYVRLFDCDYNSLDDMDKACTAIRRGTVLPEECGDLIDRKALLSHTKCTYMDDCPSGSSCDKCSDNCVEVRDIKNAPIVIEANKG